MHTPETCGMAPTPQLQPAPCVSGNGTCSLADCVTFTCPFGAEQASFECGCECPSDDVRTLTLLITELGVCLGDSLVLTYGPAAANSRCLLINSAAVVAELVDAVVDLAAQLPVLLSAPDELVLSTDGLVRAVKGVCECLADTLEDFGSPNDSDPAIAALFSVLGKTLRCVCDIALSIVDAVLRFVSDIVLWARTNTQPEQIEIAIVVLVEAIIKVFGLIAYLVAAAFYALGGLVGDLVAVGAVFEDLGDIIKEEAAAIADALLTLLQTFAACIGGIITTIINVITCLAAGGAESACQDVFTPLLTCLELIGALIIELLCAIFGEEFCCSLRKVFCFVGLVDNPFPCATLTQLQCENLNIGCVIERGFCDLLDVSVDLGCTTFACGALPLLCNAYDAQASFDLSVRTFSIAAAKIICPLCYENNRDLWYFSFFTIWPVNFNTQPLNMMSPFVFAPPQNPVPRECCVTDGNTANITLGNLRPFVDTNTVADWWFVTAYFIDDTNHFCEFKAKWACYQYIDVSYLEIWFETLNEYKFCCQHPATTADPAKCTSRRRKRQLDVNESALVSPAPAPAPVVSAAGRMCDEVLALLREVLATESSTIACIEHLEALLEDDAASTAWPPLELIVERAANSGERYAAASCARYLEHALRESPAVQLALGTSLDAYHEHPANASRSIGQWSLSRLLDVHSTHASLVYHTRYALAYTAELTGNTLRLLVEYAAAPERPARTTMALFLGAPAFSLEPEHCRLGVLPAAVVADWLTPTFGAAMRLLVQSAEGARAALASPTPSAAAETRPEVRAIRTLAAVTERAARTLSDGRVGDGVALALVSIGTSGGAHLKRALAEAAAVDDVRLAAHALRRSLTQPRTAIAARRQLAAAAAADDAGFGDVDALARLPSPEFLAAQQQRRRRKRTVDVEEPASAVSAWAERKLAALDARLTVLLREAYGTSSSSVQLAATRVNCSANTAPFVCCAEQAFCANCSAFDRLFWATQDSIESIVGYVSGPDFERAGKCLSHAVASSNGYYADPARACPAEICAAASCTSSAECAAFDTFAAGPPQVHVCNPRLRRCVLEGSTQCASSSTNVGRACIVCSLDVCALGECSVNGTCAVTEGFLRGCDCPPTYSDVVPTLWSELGALRVPCVLNYTCVLDIGLEGGSLLPAENETNPFAGRLADAIVGTAYANVIGALDTAFNGSGTALLDAIESVYFGVERAASTAGAATERLLGEFVLCDYSDDWFCPLAKPADTFCCSDTCEQRKQGVGLLGGLVWFLIALLLPTLVLRFLSLGCANLLWSQIIFMLWIPVALAFAYGGGFLCYSGTVAGYLVPAVPAMLAIFAFALSILFCTPWCLVYTFTCGFCDCVPKGRRAVRLIMTACETYCSVCVFFAFAVALPVCFTSDLQSFFGLIWPVCVRPERALIALDAYDPTAPCTTTPFPAEELCWSTPRLQATRFRDYNDAMLQAAERLSPGFNAGLNATFANTTAGRALAPFLGYLAPYTPYHTSEAIAADGALADACFGRVAPSALLGVVNAVLAVLLGVSALVFAIAFAFACFFSLVSGARLLASISAVATDAAAADDEAAEDDDAGVQALLAEAEADVERKQV